VLLGRGGSSTERPGAGWGAGGGGELRDERTDIGSGKGKEPMRVDDADRRQQGAQAQHLAESAGQRWGQLDMLTAAKGTDKQAENDMSDQHAAQPILHRQPFSAPDRDSGPSRHVANLVHTMDTATLATRKRTRFHEHLDHHGQLPMGKDRCEEGPAASTKQRRVQQPPILHMSQASSATVVETLPREQKRRRPPRRINSKTSGHVREARQGYRAKPADSQSGHLTPTKRTQQDAL